MPGALKLKAKPVTTDAPETPIKKRKAEASALAKAASKATGVAPAKVKVVKAVADSRDSAPKKKLRAESDPTAKKKRKTDSDGSAAAAPKKRVRDLVPAAPEPEPEPAPGSPRGSDESLTEAEEAPAGLLDDDARGDPRLALSNFRLSAETLGALEQRGVTALFPIQAACFDLLFDGKDLIGRARTGMGKTLAFGLPLVERVRAVPPPGRARSGRAPTALIMAPTRELAQQVAAEVESVAPSLVTLCVYGGTPFGPSCTAIRAGVDLWGQT